jgi:hypothetical protein
MAAMTVAVRVMLSGTSALRGGAVASIHRKGHGDGHDH